MGVIDLSVHMVELPDMHEDKGVRFILYKPPTIDTIEPILLSASNTSIPIIVTGDNFWDSPSLVCRFDSLHVTAKWISKF